MIKEIRFLARRNEISSGEFLFNSPNCFLPVRFWYGNQLLAFLGLLGLSGLHGFFLAVTNTFRHYFLLTNPGVLRKSLLIGSPVFGLNVPRPIFGVNRPIRLDSFLRGERGVALLVEVRRIARFGAAIYSS